MSGNLWMFSDMLDDEDIEINQCLPVMENLKPEMMAKSSLLSVRGKTMATAESVFPVRLFAS